MAALGEAAEVGDNETCTEKRLVVDERLSFVANKLNWMAPETIIQLCSSFYSDEAVDSAKYHLCVSIINIGKIRKHINQPVAELLTHALITSRLDTCNSLLHGLNKAHLKRLQRLQNTAARFSTLSGKCTHITPILKQLHLLPIEQRSIFKISMFVFKTIHGVSPTYLCSLVKPYEPLRGNMRSANKLLLT